jgi:hypothetical protein
MVEILDVKILSLIIFAVLNQVLHQKQLFLLGPHAFSILKSHLEEFDQSDLYGAPKLFDHSTCLVYWAHLCEVPSLDHSFPYLCTIYLSDSTSYYKFFHYIYSSVASHSIGKPYVDQNSSKIC